MFEQKLLTLSSNLIFIGKNIKGASLNCKV